MTPFAANAMISSTIATLECAAQVKTAASTMSIIGSVVTMPSRSRRLGASSYGVISAISCDSAISISPSPMPTRPRSRVRVTLPRRNIKTPIRTRNSEACEASNDSACTIRVVPTLAPSMTASAGT